MIYGDTKTNDIKPNIQQQFNTLKFDEFENENNEYIQNKIAIDQGLINNNSNEMIYQDHSVAHKPNSSHGIKIRTRQRKFEKKEVVYHIGHAISGIHNHDHSHVTITNFIYNEMQKIETDSNGNEICSEFWIVPGSQKQFIVSHYRERGLTSGYYKEII